MSVGGLRFKAVYTHCVCLPFRSVLTMITKQYRKMVRRHFKFRQLEECCSRVDRMSSFVASHIIASVFLNDAARPSDAPAHTGWHSWTHAATQYCNLRQDRKDSAPWS